MFRDFKSFIEISVFYFHLKNLQPDVENVRIFRLANVTWHALLSLDH